MWDADNSDTLRLHHIKHQMLALWKAVKTFVDIGAMLS
jgi:hypothetical protein